MFNTRQMLQLQAQTLPPTTFLLDMFFKNVIQKDVKVFDVDIFTKVRNTAQPVSPEGNGVTVGRAGGKTISISPAYLKPKMKISGADLLVRTPGETIYAGTSAGDHFSYLFGQDMSTLIDSCTRHVEYQAACMLNTGSFSFSGNGTTVSWDCEMPAGNKITRTGNDLWSATSTANPLGDLRTWSTNLEKSTGVRPNVAIFDVSVADAFRTFYQTNGKGGELSPIKISLGEIKPNALPNGAGYLGYLRDDGLNIDIYTYRSWYTDTNGAEQPYIPAGKVWLGNTNTQGVQCYGLIQDLSKIGSGEPTNYAVKFYPKTWVENETGIHWLMIQSAPAVIMPQANAFISASVL